jgi:hypothetical protein
MNNCHLACIVDFLRDADFYATKINLLPFIWKKYMASKLTSGEMLNCLIVLMTESETLQNAGVW